MIWQNVCCSTRHAHTQMLHTHMIHLMKTYLSHLMTKLTKWLCTQWRQISLGIRPVWSESSLWAQWVAKDPSFLHADSEDSDQTGRMPRLTWVFAVRTCHFAGFVMRQHIFLLKLAGNRACSKLTVAGLVQFSFSMIWLWSIIKS